MEKRPQVEVAGSYAKTLAHGSRMIEDLYRKASIGSAGQNGGVAVAVYQVVPLS